MSSIFVYSFLNPSFSNISSRWWLRSPLTIDSYKESLSEKEIKYGLDLVIIGVTKGILLVSLFN